MCEVTQFIKDHRFEINNGLVTISPTLDKIVRDGMKAIDNAVVEVIERHEKAIEGEFIPAGVAAPIDDYDLRRDNESRYAAAAQMRACQNPYGHGGLSGIGQAQGAFGQSAYNPFGWF